MNFATGLCHLIHEYDLIMTSNYVIVSIRLCQVIPRCWNDEYIILCNEGGGGTPPKTSRVAERKQNPVWIGLMFTVCQYWRREKHLCASWCCANCCWLRNWGLPFGRSVNNSASCFQTLKADCFSFLFFHYAKKQTLTDSKGTLRGFFYSCY